MKKFLFKTMFLLVLLSLCVIYGMITAKDGTTTFQGQSEQKEQIQSSGSNTSVKTVNASAAQYEGPTLSERAERLENSRSVQPVTSIGQAMTGVMTNVIKTGVTITSTVVDNIVQAIL
ncbi:hypothetical protein EV207_101308 [Scopulibacillus darangshiensis]|uniref:DUF3679 domain-containing protein n=1 Tax=Scopulibacillus darangshiensis TaxID=442528 RepID=A0A4R2PB44_9BACL|nr:hypothetical protein [Scopulibacillus darangshiensis]TCP32329.1 hypothetical protein EV207_101308 [Scopulibacillus darangshiensis]